MVEERKEEHLPFKIVGAGNGEKKKERIEKKRGRGGEKKRSAKGKARNRRTVNEERKEGRINGRRERKRREEE